METIKKIGTITALLFTLGLSSLGLTGCGSEKVDLKKQTQIEQPENKQYTETKDQKKSTSDMFNEKAKIAIVKKKEMKYSMNVLRDYCLAMIDQYEMPTEPAFGVKDICKVNLGDTKISIEKNTSETHTGELRPRYNLSIYFPTETLEQREGYTETLQRHFLMSINHDSRDLRYCSLVKGRTFKDSFETRGIDLSQVEDYEADGEFDSSTIKGPGGHLTRVYGRNGRNVRIIDPAKSKADYKEIKGLLDMTIERLGLSKS